MTSFYPLLTLFSMVAFGVLGWFLARNRNRNVILWLVLGAVFPPLLILLFALKPAEIEPEADDGELDEG